LLTLEFPNLNIARTDLAPNHSTISSYPKTPRRTFVNLICYSGAAGEQEKGRRVFACATDTIRQRPYVELVKY